MRVAPLVGETLGRYQLEQLVGQGGMAVVYRAVDSVLGRTVAVKVIRQAYTEDPHFLDRFLQEARLVASLDHPNILPLYDFGEQDGRPYLVMPYLPGGSLADQMAALPQPLPLVAAWTMQLAGALDTAHARGVLHRDVKPGNVLVTKDGRLMLGDFGIARLAEATTRLTATGMVVGTPIYMAPELARGADASPASDRYALAVMVYEMLAGLPPFVGSNALSVLHQQVHEPVPALVERSPDATPELDAFMTRALAKKPQERHPSARAMAEGLVSLLSPEQRASLSTLAWSGAPGSAEALPWSSPEAATVVRSGGTMRMPGPPGSAAVWSPPPGGARSSAAARAAGASRASGPARTGAAAAGGVLTSAVTAEAPRPRRGSPLVWGLLVAAAVAAAVLLLPRELLVGAKQPAGAADSGANGSGEGAPVAGGTRPTGAVAPAAGQSPATALRQTSQTAPGSSPGAGAAASAGAPAAAGPEGREVTPLDPPALGLPAAQTTRAWIVGTSRPLRRPTEAELEQLVARLGGRRPVNLDAWWLPLNTWARGALAYAQGQTSEAIELRRELAGSSVPWGVAWAAIVFGQSEPWNLTAFYADPSNELDRLLEPELPGLAGNPRAALAAAYSAHLDGDHTGAVDLLRKAGFDPAAVDPMHRALAAQFLSVEAIEARDDAEAQRWMRYAIEGSNVRLVGGFINEVAALTAHSSGAAKAIEVRSRLCSAAPAACGLQQQRPALQSPILRRQQQRVVPVKPNQSNKRPWGAKPRGTPGGGGVRRNSR